MPYDNALYGPDHEPQQSGNPLSRGGGNALRRGDDDEEARANLAAMLLGQPKRAKPGDVIDRGMFLPWERTMGHDGRHVDSWAVPGFLRDIGHAASAVGSASAYGPERRPSQMDEADLDTMMGHAGAGAGVAMTGGFGRMLSGAARNELGSGGSRLPHAVQPEQPGIRAYHGSPHDFDKFDMSKIGTGDGVQAFGHGLYFAENEGVARSYRDIITQNQVWNALKGKKYNDDGSLNLPAAGAEWLQSGISRKELLSEFAHYAPKSTAEQKTKWLDEADRLRVNAQRKGHMYEVNIKAEPENFLDWDRPLSQQPKPVADLIDKFYPNLTPEQKLQIANEPGSAVYNGIGVQLRKTATDNGPLNDKKTLNDILRKVNRTDLASSEFRDAGVPGIRYRDALSRASDVGTSNLVLFDDKLVSIVRKYMAAGMTLGAATAAAQRDAGNSGNED